MKIFRKILLLAIIGAFLSSDPPEAQGTTFYISTAGNDANAGTELSPWRTVQKAASTLTAGQTALIRGGTYNENNITFTNSGTAGNPITLKNYPGETPIIDGGFTTSSGIDPVFFLDGQSQLVPLSYWTFDGLTVRRGSRANYWIARDDDVENIIIRNGVCEDFVTGDNGACIFINPGSSNITITNNVIHDRILGGASENVGNGIIVFRHHGYLDITHNEIYNLVHGIYYKHNDAGSMTTLVENNKIHNMIAYGLLWTMHDAIIRNNVIYSSNRAIRVFEEAGTCDTQAAHGNQILHNTLVDNIAGAAGAGVLLSTRIAEGGCTGALNTVVRDNLIIGFGSSERGVAVHPFQPTDLSNTTLTFNLISTATLSSPVRVLNSYYNLASIPVSVTNSNNTGDTPSFQDAAAHNYTLLPGPGKNAASDGQDMGVVSFCNVGVGGCLPSAPTNLRIVPQ